LATSFPKDILNKLIAGMIVVLKWIGSMTLAIMMFLTAVDVVCRYILNRPILGSMELVEYMMAVAIPFSVAYCAFCKAHVAVDFIFDHFPKLVQKIIAFPIKILTLLLVLVITWQSYLNIIETYESKMTSAVLLIVSYPFVIPMAVGMGVFSLILFNDLLPGVKEKK